MKNHIMIKPLSKICDRTGWFDDYFIAGSEYLLGDGPQRGWIIQSTTPDNLHHTFFVEGHSFRAVSMLSYQMDRSDYEDHGETEVDSPERTAILNAIREWHG